MCQVRLEYLQAPSRILPRLTVLAAPAMGLDRGDYPTPIGRAGQVATVSMCIAGDLVNVVSARRAGPYNFLDCIDSVRVDQNVVTGSSDFVE